ncbi:MAG: DUF3793 family protein [Firmicutes bacterium]|nr:DUF3793 family protein [Bacillota bacterium]
MSEQLMVKHCSPTLAGIKTGNLFSCSYTTKDALFSSVRQINRKLKHKGIRVLPLRFSKRRALIYVYRPAILGKDLSREEAVDILKESGYEKENGSYCLRQLAKRLREGDGFPHEVGLFLSYPPEDVRGFMVHKGANCKCVGCWKVYGDAEEAQRLFDDYKSCSEYCYRQWQNGATLEELTAEVCC